MGKHEKNESRCPLGGRIISFIFSMSILFNTAYCAPTVSAAKPVENKVVYERTIVEKIEKIESIIEPEVVLKSTEEIVSEINLGLWGTGDERRTRLIEAGYDYDKIQSIVNTRYQSVPKVTPTRTYTGTGLTKRGGVYWNPNTGLKETWYSQKVLPGGGLSIPGRHVNSEGFVCDGDGYICVSSSTYPKGTVIETSRGMGKVYDTGCAPGVLDIYVNW